MTLFVILSVGSRVTGHRVGSRIGGEGQHIAALSARDTCFSFD